jgi:polysaccharide pyruvyl transferase WcaK-like protein
MARCEAIVSMRLHGIIFAYLLGIPFISLEYDQKNRNFCESIGYPKELVLKFDLEKKSDQIYDALNILFENKFETLGMMSREQAIKVVTARFNELTHEMRKKLYD